MTKNNNDILLRVRATKFDGALYQVIFKGFKVGDAANDYVLTAGKYVDGSGSQYADDWLEMDGNKFSARDRDNDQKLNGNCAQIKKGGNWFGSCTKLNFNGVWYASLPNGDDAYKHMIYWVDIVGGYHNLKTIDLSIRKDVNDDYAV